LVIGAWLLVISQQEVQLKKIRYIDDLAKLDLCRGERTGIPEAVFAEAKQPADVVSILKALAEEKGYGMATRVTPECFEKIKKTDFSPYKVEMHLKARIVVVSKKNRKQKKSNAIIGLLAAGTADISIAEEVKVTATEMGCEVIYAYDVGVAGIHRLTRPLKEMAKKKVSVIVVVAGMDAVLPIVVKGMTAVPVIGVPTSIGYGYGGGGEAALMTMLQSCSPGLVVVNIDNGFGAGAAAALIAKGKAKGCND
jgi:NCAIR mutase (PurE)-related protein